MNEAPPITLSEHAQLRLAQRNVSAEQVRYVLRHGTKVHRTGAVFFVLRQRDVPPHDLRRDTIAKIIGLIVLVEDGQITTVYRNKSPLKHIRRKAAYARRAA